MESENDAREWLTSPQAGLGGAVPLQYAETEVGDWRQLGEDGTIGRIGIAECHY